MEKTEEVKQQQQQTFISNKLNGKNEEHNITVNKTTPTEILKKSLKTKSHSQTAIRVGPFAAIREAETERRRRQNGGSMDVEELVDSESLKASMSEGTFTINDKKINKNINRDTKN
ncbi:hypothetical protein Mgra_00008169 [Meloidogyne graminicola]|uniref:Uncharacterized protein n=1 Tax=Meloidogyne graminicola TaxID=189291 RepID=A0A8S9ZGG0_9BILA|nr:hypothetical protein Mgra_00008169 [Meloidogyne graminicola]